MRWVGIRALFDRDVLDLEAPWRIAELSASLKLRPRSFINWRSNDSTSGSRVTVVLMAAS
jgi:hypothetical protein